MKIRAEVDTKALGSLLTGLTAVASGETGREIARECAAEAQGFLRDEFAQGRGPDGKAWPAPRDGGRPGWRSGDLGRSAEAVPLGPRIQLRAGVPYARFFIRGTSRMKAREVFPTRRIPPSWKAAFENAVRRVIRRRLTRGR